MRNTMEVSSIDHNPNKPAQKHQESARKRAEEDNEVQDPSRRGFMRTMLEGAAAGIAAGAGLKTIIEVHKAYDTFSQKKEDEFKKENPEASEIQSQIDSIRGDIGRIKEKTRTVNVIQGAGYTQGWKEKFSAWEKELDFLEKEGKKLRAKEETIPLNVIFNKLEELGKKVSLEELESRRSM